MPSVGVILATYNGEKFIEDQINSIISQRDISVFLYVRDDRSSDITLNIIRAFAAAHPGKIILLDNAKDRFGAACENFLSILLDVPHHKHDYFAFADQDDIWLPYKLKRAVQMLRENEASGYASNLIAFSEARGEAWVIDKAGRQRAYDHLFQSASAGCTYVLDRRAAGLIAEKIERLDGHDWKGMSHDWLCYAICRSHGLRWVIDERPGIRYRQHDQNLFGAMPGVGGMIKRLSLMREGWYRSVLLRNRAFLNPENRQEQAILDRVARLSVTDRLWLASRVGKLRREFKSRLALALAFLLGLI
nr:glycosyltransferase [Sphingobium boeckii]